MKPTLRHVGTRITLPESDPPTATEVGEAAVDPGASARQFDSVLEAKVREAFLGAEVKVAGSSGVQVLLATGHRSSALEQQIGDLAAELRYSEEWLIAVE
jgi:hypothetical protein